MASKNCPHCSKQVPVACKKCGCGHVFFTSRRTAASICRDTAAAAASSSEAPVADDIQDNPGEGSNQPTRRSGRVTRERPNFYDALEYENQTRRGNNADGAFRKVLVTVGTTQFDDLVDMIFHPSTLETFHGWGVDSVSLQVGSSSFNKLGQFHTNGIHFNAVKYLPKLGDEMAKADLIICHGGAGTTMEALELGKPVIVVPNRKLMDDHQLELAGKLEEGGHVVLTSVDTFNEDVRNIDSDMFLPLPPSHPQKFADFLYEFLTTN